MSTSLLRTTGVFITAEAVQHGPMQKMPSQVHMLCEYESVLQTHLSTQDALIFTSRLFWDPNLSTK
jgi:hypothetical protein